MNTILRNVKNPFAFYYNLTKRFGDFIQKALFFLYKKPLYTYSYNSNGNKFRCRGIITRTRLAMGGANNTLIIESGATVNGMRIEIGGSDNTFIIHKDVTFSEGGRVMLSGKGNRIEIGENSNIVNVFFVVTDNNTRVEIGNNCLFSAEVIIRTSDQHCIFNNEGKCINDGRDVIIGDHVWIGYGATILKGSILETNSIVGTESVVAGLHLPANSVAVGNPARIVKSDINWKR